MQFEIEHLWNGSKVTHDPVTLTLQPSSSGSTSVFQIVIDGPLFNDPAPPKSSPGILVLAD